VQTPLYDALFFEYFLVAFVTPLVPILRFLGGNCGFDLLHCTASKRFAKEVYDWPTQDLTHVCSILLSNQSIHHLDHRSIVNAVNDTNKYQIAIFMMHLVDYYFEGEIGGQYNYLPIVNPLNGSSRYK
jgi:hypothetical protein